MSPVRCSENCRIELLTVQFRRPAKMLSDWDRFFCGIVFLRYRSGLAFCLLGGGGAGTSTAGGDDGKVDVAITNGGTGEHDLLKDSERHVFVALDDNLAREFFVGVDRHVLLF